MAAVAMILPVYHENRCVFIKINPDGSNCIQIVATKFELQ
jgi:hypothetical protein